MTYQSLYDEIKQQWIVNKELKRYYKNFIYGEQKERHKITLAGAFQLPSMNMIALIQMQLSTKESESPNGWNDT